MNHVYYNIKPILTKLRISIPVPKDAEGNSVDPELLCKIFPCKLVEQELNQKDEYIEIPYLVDIIYSKYRPTPLVRAVGLEKYFKTKFPIYYKREDLTLSGSHKINTAFAQAYFAKQEGVSLVTETGAGQWGTALSLAGSLLGVKIKVFMVRVSYEQKKYRKIIMNLFGANVTPSPSKTTSVGKTFLKDKDNKNGSLGMAISEAIDYVINSKGQVKYALGSVLDSVLMHQTIIGLEVLEQVKVLGINPGAMIGCVGGGSNFAGFAFPMLGQKLKGIKDFKNTEFYAVEPKNIPSLTKGEYKYDFGDSAGLTPRLLMHTLGYQFVPPPIHAGGLRYHGMAPLVSLLYKNKFIKAVAVSQEEVFKAAHIFIQNEGIVPAPETAHAIAGVIRTIKRYKRKGIIKPIVFNFSGHGLLDLEAYKEVGKAR